MNLFIAIATLIALSVFSSNEPGQSLEKQAVSSTQRILASDLDAELPRLPFTDWFGKVVGQGAGVVWQLSECGEHVDAANNAGGDAQACVEVNAMLPDGRMVIVMFVVGTFKKGVTGPPAFQFGVIGKKGEMRPIRRLGNLPKLLSAPWKLVNSHPVRLPDVNMPKVRPAASGAPVARWPRLNEGELGLLASIEEPAPVAPPAQRTAPASSKATPTTGNREASEDPDRTTTGGDVKLMGPVSWGDVITRVQPRYPARARRVNASGQVEVQIIISEEGRVIQAKATSGNPLLREAAVEAARQWVFKPAVLNGVPVRTETTLVFGFTVPK
jgi:TonB family protein